jgi:ATP-dependent RNA helicase RhlE
MAFQMTSFTDLGLSAPLLRALDTEGYATPTPIQAKAIPHVLIERLLAAPRQRAPRRCRVLVLAPTRELASQIHDSFRAYGRHTGLTSVVVYGGVGQRPQADALMRGVDVLVATPGRLLDLVGQRLADLRSVEFLVLDEADRMLDMGFIHDVRRIVDMLPRERQTLFFSATLPAEVRRLADAMLRDPLEVQTAPQATPAETVAQSVFHVAKSGKKAALVSLLRESPMDRVIVFTRTKHGADKLQRDLAKAGIDAAAIHGNKSQNQRERALAAFKAPRPPVLIATDIAARGIDVDDVSHVVNFELPHEPETYVHRIGRTGRAGRTGEAVSFCDPEERLRLRAIERLLQRSITSRNAPPAGADDDVTETEAGTERSSRGRNRGGRQGGHQSGRQGTHHARQQGGGGGGRSRRGRSRGTTATASRPVAAQAVAAPVPAARTAPVAGGAVGNGRVKRRYRRGL